MNKVEKKVVKAKKEAVAKRRATKATALNPPQEVIATVEEMIELHRDEFVFCTRKEDLVDRVHPWFTLSNHSNRIRDAIGCRMRIYPALFKVVTPFVPVILVSLIQYDTFENRRGKWPEMVTNQLFSIARTQGVFAGKRIPSAPVDMTPVQPEDPKVMTEKGPHGEMYLIHNGCLIIMSVFKDARESDRQARIYYIGQHLDFINLLLGQIGMSVDENLLLSYNEEVPGVGSVRMSFDVSYTDYSNADPVTHEDMFCTIAQTLWSYGIYASPFSSANQAMLPQNDFVGMIAAHAALSNLQVLGLKASDTNYYEIQGTQVFRDLCERIPYLKGIKPFLGYGRYRRTLPEDAPNPILKNVSEGDKQTLIAYESRQIAKALYEKKKAALLSKEISEDLRALLVSGPSDEASLMKVLSIAA